MLGDRRLFRKVKPRKTVKDLKIFVLVQVLYIAPHLIKLTHEFVVSGADEQLRPALELLGPLPRLRKNESVNAPAKLMEAIHHFTGLARRNVHLKHAKKTPGSTERRRYNKLFLHPANRAACPTSSTCTPAKALIKFADDKSSEFC
jgi:hypothetical protein